MDSLHFPPCTLISKTVTYVIHAVYVIAQLIVKCSCIDRPDYESWLTHGAFSPSWHHTWLRLCAGDPGVGFRICTKQTSQSRPTNTTYRLMTHQLFSKVKRHVNIAAIKEFKLASVCVVSLGSRVRNPVQ